jgi:surface antigen
MKILKKVLIILGSVVGLVLIIALFLPSKMKVERSIEIARPVEEVYPMVADFNNFAKWNSWSQMEPDAQTNISGTPMQPGHTWSWKGNKTGTGIMKIESAKANESLDVSLNFKEPMESTAMSYYKFEPAPSGTKVTWGFEGEAKYPHGRIFGLFIDQQLGSQFEQGLESLKKMAEGK